MPLIECLIYDEPTIVPSDIACPHIRATGECKRRCYILKIPRGPVRCPNPHCAGHFSLSEPECHGPDGVVLYAEWRAFRAVIYDVTEVRGHLSCSPLALAGGRDGGPVGYRVADDDDWAYGTCRVFNGARMLRGDPTLRPRPPVGLVAAPLGAATLVHYTEGAHRLMPPWRLRILREIDQRNARRAGLPRAGGLVGHENEPGDPPGLERAADDRVAEPNHRNAVPARPALRRVGGVAGGGGGEAAGVGNRVIGGSSHQQPARGVPTASGGEGARAAGGMVPRARGSGSAEAEDDGDELLPGYAERARPGERTVNAEEVDYVMDDD